MDAFTILFLIAMIAIFYFLIFRPQSKRRKEQQALMSSLSVGDEVSTIGGILGQITKVSDDFITISVTKGVELRMQKFAVSATLPKGTLSGLPAEQAASKKD